MTSSGTPNRFAEPGPHAAAAPGLWRRWKKLWRRLETSPPVLRVKRRVKQLAGTELRYSPQLRMPRKHAGGWCYAPHLLERGATVYSLGVGEDVEFDLRLIEQVDARVHAFDPTPGAVRYVEGRKLPDNFVMHQLGIADFDGEAEFSGPVSEGNVCFTLLQRTGGRTDPVVAPVRRLSTMMSELGHDRIDLLKMDIEGAEYTVLPDLVKSRIEVKQLLVEFHHRFAGVGLEMTREAVDLLLHHGFKILHISPSGREYTFIHSPGAPAAP